MTGTLPREMIDAAIVHVKRILKPKANRIEMVLDDIRFRRKREHAGLVLPQTVGDLPIREYIRVGLRNRSIARLK